MSAFKSLLLITLLLGACGDSDDDGGSDETQDAGDGSPDASSGEDHICGRTGGASCGNVCAFMHGCVVESSLAEMIAPVVAGFGFDPEEPGECGGCLDACNDSLVDEGDVEVLECFQAQSADTFCAATADPTVAANAAQSCCEGHLDTGICRYICNAVLRVGPVAEMVPTCFDLENDARQPGCQGDCPAVEDALLLPIESDDRWRPVTGALDPSGGRLAVLLMTQGDIDLGSDKVSSLGTAATQVLAVYDLAGKLQWSQVLGGDFEVPTGGVQFAKQVVFDADGNLYVGTRLSGTADLGEGDITASGPSDAVVASYTRDGDLRWVRQLGGKGGSRIVSLWADADRVLAVGTFEDGLEVGGERFAAEGTGGAFVMGLDPQGKVQWARAVDGAEGDLISNVVGLPGGDHIMVGYTSDGGDLGDGPLKTEEIDGFVARIGDDGEVVWKHVLQGPTTQWCYLAAPGPDWMTTQCFTTDPIEFGGRNYEGDISQMLSRFDLDGKVLPFEGYEDTATLVAHDHLVHPQGGIALLAAQGAAIDTGAGTLDSLRDNLLIARYDDDGKHLWSTNMGGVLQELVLAGAYTDDGELLIAMEITDVLDHGDGTLETDGPGVALLRFAAE